MNCNCLQLADLFYLSEAPPSFESSLIEKDVGNWVFLKECPQCKQLWRIDAWDKYQTQFALKVPSSEGWEELDSVPMVKDLLLNSRGGTTDEICIWAGCDGKRVKGVVYCIDHLYETGARK